MSKRKIYVLTDCSECGHFDNTYYSYNQRCTKLERNIPPDENGHDFPIPDDCPLPDVQPENNE